MELLVQTLTPVEGYAPTSGIDSSGNTYLEFGLNDGASFDFVIPNDYVAGEDLTLGLREASPNASKNHKWSIQVTVNNTYNATYTAEYISSSSAGTISTRAITCSTSGAIGGHSLASGDIVAMVITRVSASTNEDSGDIKLYIVTVSTATSLYPTITCLGRVGQIVRKVLGLFNDDTQKFLDQNRIISSINECQRQIAIRGYFNTSTDIDLVAGQAAYNLDVLCTNPEHVTAVVWNGDTRSERLVSVTNKNRYIDIVNTISSSERVFGYYLEGNVLYPIPVPSQNKTAALTVFYIYFPNDLGCLTNYTPLTPAAHDDVYVYYALWEAYARDRHAPMAADMLRMYRVDYERALSRLMAQTSIPGLKMRSYR